MTTMTVRNYFFTSVLTLSSALAVVGCKKPAPPPPVGATQLGPESYVVATNGTIESGPVISGTLVPRDQAVVRAQMPGAILKIYADQGKAVRAGDVLAEIDNGSLSEALASAKNSLVNAQNSLTVASKELERQEALLKAGAISQQSVDQARRNKISSEAGVAQAQAQLSGAQKQLSYSVVHAPFSGVISEKSVSLGDVVQPGTALFTVVEPSTLELQAMVPANALNVVHVGLPVSFAITGYQGQSFTGKITRINPTADPMTRQVRIYAEIPNGGHTLVGGLYAEGRVASIEKNTLMLPADAVDHRMISPGVMKLQAGVVTRAVVTLGTLDEKSGLIEVTSGLSSGDTVLRGAARDIALGTKVKTTSPKS